MRQRLEGFNVPFLKATFVTLSMVGRYKKKPVRLYKCVYGDLKLPL